MEPLDEGVVADLVCTQSVRRVERKAPTHQVAELWVKRVEHGTLLRNIPAGVSCTLTQPPRHRTHVGLNLANVSVLVPQVREQTFPTHQLKHNAPQGPYVHCVRPRQPEHYLHRPVRQGADQVFVALRGVEGGRAKVADGPPVAVYVLQDVLWLQVRVDDLAVEVQEAKCAADLREELRSEPLREHLLALQACGAGVAAQREDKARPAVRLEVVQQACHLLGPLLVHGRDLLQHLQLNDSIRVELLLHNLESHVLLRLQVACT